MRKGRCECSKSAFLSLAESASRERCLQRQKKPLAAFRVQGGAKRRLQRWKPAGWSWAAQELSDAPQQSVARQVALEQCPQRYHDHPEPGAERLWHTRCLHPAVRSSGNCQAVLSTEEKLLLSSGQEHDLRYEDQRLWPVSSGALLSNLQLRGFQPGIVAPVVEEDSPLAFEEL